MKHLPCCPWCGFLAPVVHVHGHGQCTVCHTNIEPCCAGDNGGDACTASSRGGPAPDTPPSLFPQLFDALGGRDRTVTQQALLFALSQRLDCDLDDARLVLEAAERIGLIRTVASGLHRLQELDPPPT